MLVTVKINRRKRIENQFLERDIFSLWTSGQARVKYLAIFFYLSPPFNFLYPFKWLYAHQACFFACFCLNFGNYMYINYKLLSSVIIYHDDRYIFSLLCNIFQYDCMYWFMVSLKYNSWQSATYVSFCVGSCPERMMEQSFRKMVPQQALNLDSHILI